MLAMDYRPTAITHAGFRGSDRKVPKTELRLRSYGDAAPHLTYGLGAVSG
jgi:hypothetical protein